MLAVVVDLSRLGQAEAIAQAVESTRAHIRSARPAPGFDDVLLPGEPERRSAAARRESGIPVDEKTWQDILEAAAILGITEGELDPLLGGDRGPRTSE